ncbi:hypothetical protein F4860DRAFT_523706 [Xylaria cubensis]|nr:hypothetical protein F4860DRAFT_523706 [Xylaria cubensis]
MAAVATQTQPANNLFSKVSEKVPSTKPTKHDVEGGIIDYLKPNEDGSPYKLDYHDLGTFMIPITSYPVKVWDVTGDEDKFTLDNCGFQFVKHASAEKNFEEYNHLKEGYYQETADLLKKVTGASRVFVYNHIIRNSNFEFDAAKFKEDNVRPPCQRIHADHSHNSGLGIVRTFLPDEAEELLKRRVQIIHVWRPITMIERDPLVLADHRHMPEEDLIATPVEGPTLNGEICYVNYNPNHRWYYKYHLTPDEVIMFKAFDNLRDGRAERAAHASCDVGVGPEVPPRRSVEVRAIVIHDDVL